MCTFLLPKTIIDQIDKYRKHYLWCGINARNSPKAAWNMFCLPKEEGGLGVLNLKTQNEALMMKNLHKFYNKVDTHGYNWSGTSTIKMVNWQVTSRKVLSGGVTI